MTNPDWMQTIERWRLLPLEERLRRHLQAIPRHVANSMAMEGEPVAESVIRARLAERNREIEPPKSPVPERKNFLTPTKAQNMSPRAVIVALMEGFEGKPCRYPFCFQGKGEARVKAGGRPETRHICTPAPTDNRHAQAPTYPEFANRS